MESQALAPQVRESDCASLATSLQWATPHLALRTTFPSKLGKGFSRRPHTLLQVLAVALAALAAPQCASAFPWPASARIAPACVATVNKAALQAMDRTLPLGQMQIFGDPAVFDPHLLRVTVRVFGARTEIYAVDVAIDDACRILSASTRLETSEWPYR